MCMSSPDIPKPSPPPQEAKAPDSMGLRRDKRKNPLQGGTLLTGPSGVASGALNTGGNTLLGG